MVERSGTLLERDVSRLFKLAGFEPQNNVFIEGYEIDIFAQIESYSIIIECKQYERSSLAVRNLIHQWDSKNRIIKASRVLLVLIGCNVTQKDNQLAQKFGITIWNEKWFEHFTNLAIKDKERVRFEILASLKINLILPEIDSIVNTIASLGNKFDNKLAKAKTSEEHTSVIDYIVKEGVAKTIEILNIIRKLKKEGADEYSIKKLIDCADNDVMGTTISNTVHNSIFNSLEDSITDPRNRDKITKTQMKELKTFFKRIKKYLKKHNGTEKIKSTEGYNHIKEEIINLDKSGKLEGFAQVFTTIEDAVGYKDLIKIVNKGYNEIEKIRNEIT